MVVDVKVTSSTQDLLENYDADDLLRTIPYNYQLDMRALMTYKGKIKSTTKTTIQLSNQIHDWLIDLSKNNNIAPSLLFNFLIETVANCGKIHTKNIKNALNCYYYAATYNRSLLAEILSEYAQSNFYSTETGLSEEGVALFLTMSEDGKKLIHNITLPENPTGQNYTPTNSIIG